MVMVVAAFGGIAKWFGSKRGGGDDDADGQGDDPIVKAIFKAFNTGDLDSLRDHIDKDCRVAINSIEVARDDSDHGFDLWSKGVNQVRDTFPDVHWELYDELSGKDDDKHKIAVRLVSTVTDDGQEQQFELAAFGVVDDKKLTEWHQVADQATYDWRREQTGADPLGK